MKLYWGPHTCAIGIHVLLKEAEVAYETARIDVSGGATRHSDFLKINPKGKVPTLVRDDGSVLAEFGAIATWLAKIHPAKKLLPIDSDAEARSVEMLEYVEGTGREASCRSMIDIADAALFYVERVGPCKTDQTSVERRAPLRANAESAVCPQSA